MQVLEPAVRSYAWGSRTALARLRGQDGPADHPEAELWFGAHPAAPAHVDGVRLDELIASDPRGQLGSEAVDAFGPRLPFLLKLLAAEEPLSLQAHPSAEQACEGFDREEREGVPIDSPMRNYRDRDYKPEVIVALDRFDALAGFRDPVRTVDLLTEIDAPELEPYVELLRGQPDESGLRALFTTWITLPQTAVHELLPGVLDGCVRYLREKGGDGTFATEMRSVLQIGEAYPGDVGVLASLLLNRVILEPGRGLHLPAGNLHAYLHGTGVEIMANSDNVLRGGLTPKHVDVPELLRVLDFRSVAARPMGDDPAPGDGPARERRYPSDTPEFRLTELEVGPSGADPHRCGPEILLCTRGAAEVFCGGTDETIRAGQAIWVPASDPQMRIRAAGTDSAQIFRAQVGMLQGD